MADREGRVVGYAYDNNGNLVTKIDSTGTTSYTWDFENRLTSVALPGTGGTVSFKYDPFGRRIQKSSGSATTNYAYDGDNIVEELSSTGTAVARYAQGLGIDEPLVMYRSGATSYYHADGLGSISALTNSTGLPTAAYAYDSFGTLAASAGNVVNPYRYTAREFDPETGLYYYRARYYDPSVGRFISEDPIGFEVVNNFYPYVGNRATVGRDPSGLVTVVPLPAGNIHTMTDIDPSCASSTNPGGETAGGCNKVGYTVDWTGCADCGHSPRFTVTLTGSIYVAAGPFPYKGRSPADRSVISTATALAHEQRHTDDKVNAIRPILEAVEVRKFPSEAACEAAAEAAAVQAAPRWDQAARESQRRRH